MSNVPVALRTSHFALLCDSDEKPRMNTNEHEQGTRRGAVCGTGCPLGMDPDECGRCTVTWGMRHERSPGLRHGPFSRPVPTFNFHFAVHFIPRPSPLLVRVFAERLF